MGDISEDKKEVNIDNEKYTIINRFSIPNNQIVGLFKCFSIEKTALYMHIDDIVQNKLKERF